MALTGILAGAGASGAPAATPAAAPSGGSNLKGLLAPKAPSTASSGPINASLPTPQISDIASKIASASMPQGSITFSNTSKLLPSTPATGALPAPQMTDNLTGKATTPPAGTTGESAVKTMQDLSNPQPISTPIQKPQIGDIGKTLVGAIVQAPQALMNLVKGLVTQEVSPSTDELNATDNYLPGGAQLLGSANTPAQLPYAVAQDLAIPAKVMSRFFQPLIQGAGQNIADSILANSSGARSHYGLTTDDIANLPSAQETILQGVGNFMQLGLAIATPEIGSKLGVSGASEDTMTQILKASAGKSASESFAPLARIVGQAAVKSAVNGGQAGVLFGTAQVLSSGETDPDKIASTVFQSAMGMAMLGLVTGGAGVGKDAATIALTKDIKQTFGVPTKVYVDAKTIDDYVNTGKITDAQAKEVFDQIGGLGEMQKQAKEQGTSVNKLRQTGANFTITPEEMISMTDKPYWAAIKGAFGAAPTGPVVFPGKTELSERLGLPQDATSAAKSEIADNLSRNHPPAAIADEMTKTLGTPRGASERTVHEVSEEMGRGASRAPVVRQEDIPSVIEAAAGKLKGAGAIDVEPTHTVSELKSSGHDWDGMIKSGDVPRSDVYNEDGTLVPGRAEHTVSDLAEKLEKISGKSVADSFRKAVDMTHPTPENLIAQAEKFATPEEDRTPISAEDAKQNEIKDKASQVVASLNAKPVGEVPKGAEVSHADLQEAYGKDKILDLSDAIEARRTAPVEVPMTKKQAKNPIAIQKLINEITSDRNTDIRTLTEYHEKGSRNLNDFDRKVTSGGDLAAGLHTAITLKQAHISYNNSKLDYLRAALKEVQSNAKPIEIKTPGEKVSETERPTTPEEAAERYYDAKIGPAIKNGDAVVIGADDLKDFFKDSEGTGDYSDDRHPIYSKAAFMLYERALQEVKDTDVILIGGGPGSAKTEVLVNKIAGAGFKGIVYDSNLANLEGAKRQIDLARAAGKHVQIHGILANVENAAFYTAKRAEATGRDVSEKSFINGHAGFPSVALSLIEKDDIPESDVSIIDLRNVHTIEEAKKTEPVENPLDVLKGAQYGKEHVSDLYKAGRERAKSAENVQDSSVQKQPRKASAENGPDSKGNEAGNDVSVEPFEGFKDLTTSVLDKLKGRTTVSKTFISDLSKSPDLKQAERNLIQRLLQAEPPLVNVAEFANKVRTELLPLERQTVPDDSMNGDEGNKYASVTLPENVRGPIAGYNEHIYESPIKTSAGNVHFNGMTDSYFAHSRTEDLPVGEVKVTGKDLDGNPIYDMPDQSDGEGGIRRVIEVQSDLFQKGRLEAESGEKSIRPARAVEDTDREIAQIDSSGNTEVRNAGETQKMRDVRDAEIARLEPYRNTFHERIIREEIKQAAIEGKTALQFPTGETAMKIEGLGQSNAFQYISNASGTNKYVHLTPDDLKVGMMVRGIRAFDEPKFIVTEILGDGKFKAVPQHLKEKADKDLLDDIDSYAETFDISGKLDTKNPIYKFYQDDIGKYLKNKYDGDQITDPQGVSWWQIDVPKEAATEPVGAFASRPAVKETSKKEKAPADEGAEGEEPTPEDMQAFHELQFAAAEVEPDTTKWTAWAQAGFSTKKEMDAAMKDIQASGESSTTSAVHKIISGKINFKPDVSTASEWKSILGSRYYKVFKRSAESTVDARASELGFENSDDLRGAVADEIYSRYNRAANKRGFINPGAIGDDIAAAAKHVNDLANATKNSFEMSEDKATDMYRLRGENQADIETMYKILASAPLLSGDDEALYHKLEEPLNPTNKLPDLTPSQAAYKEAVIDPLIELTQAADKIIDDSGLPDQKDSGYVARMPKGKNTIGDRLFKPRESEKPYLATGSLLRKTDSSDNARTMYALTNEKTGERIVVSIKNHEYEIQKGKRQGDTIRSKRVTAFKNPKDEGKDLGRFNFKTKEQIQKSEIAPVQEKIAVIQHQIDDLAARSRERGTAANKMVSLGKKIDELIQYVDSNVGTFTNDELMPDIREIQAKSREYNALSQVKQSDDQARANLADRIVSLQSQMIALTNHLADIENKYDENDLKGRVFKANDGSLHKIGQATTLEIEARSPVQYWKSATVSTVAHALSRMKIARAITMMNAWLEAPEADLIFQKDDKPAPEGWAKTDWPQFRTYFIEPRTRAVLDDFYHELQKSPERLDSILAKTNRFLTHSVFFSPIVHPLNTASTWLVDQGANWINPLAWNSSASAMAKAINAIRSKNEDYMDAMRAGVPFQASLVGSDQLANLVLKKMGTDLDTGEDNNTLAKSLGFDNVLAMKSAIGRAWHTMAFKAGDLFFLQAVYQRQAATGMTFAEALKDTSRFIPDYRIPSTFTLPTKFGAAIGTRAIPKAFGSSNGIFLAARYHVGLMHSLGAIAGDIAAPKEGFSSEGARTRGRALGKAAMLALATYYLMHQGKKFVDWLTGNPLAYPAAGGTIKLAVDFVRLLQGDEAPATYVNSLMPGAPLAMGVAEVALNRDSFTGDPIYGAPNAIGFGAFAESLLSPLSAAQEYTPAAFAWSFLAIHDPTTPLAKTRFQSLEYDVKPGLQKQVNQDFVKGDNALATQQIDDFNQQIISNYQQALVEEGKLPLTEPQAAEVLKAYGMKAPGAVAFANAAQIYNNSQVVNKTKLLDTVVAYAQAIGTDPATAFSRIFSGQRILRVDNPGLLNPDGAVIVQRLPLAASEAVRAQDAAAQGISDQAMKGLQLDHVIALELGGTNETSNLNLITTDQNEKENPIVENFLSTALKNGEVSRANINEYIIRYKAGTLGEQLPKSFMDEYENQYGGEPISAQQIYDLVNSGKAK